MNRGKDIAMRKYTCKHWVSPRKYKPGCKYPAAQEYFCYSGQAVNGGIAPLYECTSDSQRALECPYYSEARFLELDRILGLSRSL